MSEGPTASGAAQRLGSGTTRLRRAWQAMPHESRLAAFASAALFLTLFLPWYQVTLIAPAKSARLESASATITGWGAFSFVEAAVLLVAAAVLTLLFQRAEGRAFHLPGGDGAVITAAGLWTCLLIVWGIFDKPGATTKGPSATTSGIEWGIFFALAAAVFLAYSGSRIRAAHKPEPSPPVRPRRPQAAAPSPATDRPRRRATATATDLFERVIPDDPPTMRFGRAKLAEVDITIRRRSPQPVEEQLTIPFRDDETLRLGEDATVPLGDDATVPLGDDATVPLGDDGTVPLGDDATVPLGDDATVPLGDDDTLRLGH